MQSRSKWWILTIVLLFVFSFLYVFQPIRMAPKANLQKLSTFRYTFAQPLAQGAPALAAKATEINNYLTGQGLQLDHVKFVEPNVLEVETLALDKQQAQSDSANLIKALSTKYPGVKSVPLPEQTAVAQPVATFGPFALYEPIPQLRLGLDLVGGVHVVLRCMPKTTFNFTSPDDHPMTQPTTVPGAPAPPTTTASGKPIVPSKVTPENLASDVKAVLVRAGATPDTVTVTVPADNMLVVNTQAANDQVAQKQKKLITDFLASRYPGVTITGATPESIFLEKDTAAKVENIINRRLYELGVREPIVQVQGNDRIIVELPGVKDPERVMTILKSTAMLEFRLIPKRYEPLGAASDDYSEWRDAQTGQTVPWDVVQAQTRAEFTGRDLQSNARVETSTTSGWVVHFDLRSGERNKFRDFTGHNIGRLMAIVLDNKVVMAPSIKSEIPGSGIIEGKFTSKEARNLELLLNAGALPVPLEIAENRTISATLGSYAIHRSLTAGIVGFALVVLFMAFYYRLPGALADVALCLYVFIVLAVLVFAGSTLTLPGIAGIILSIGMAVDANVLIFERLKEEIWAGKSMRAAIDAGFERAWTAILDSNMNSLIVAAVLYFLGTSEIKSFAVTLFVGVVCSLFTAVTVSRWLVTMVGNSRLGQKLHVFGVRTQEA